MERIALLLSPSSNRVYGRQSGALALAELALAGRGALEQPASGAAQEVIGGVDYLTFEVPELTQRAATVLSHLSGTFAIFRATGSGLVPVDKVPLTTLPDDLVTIQRYQGKTNEQFTRLLINAAAFVSDLAPQYIDRRFCVFDPMCGRGTTLNQSLLLGWDAKGIEIDGKDVEAYAVFIERWLKDHRLKHSISFSPLRRDGRLLAKRLEATFAASKDQHRAGDVQRLDVWAADTLEVEQFLRPRSVDLIVGDAPYGVRHGSRSQGGRLERSPLSLLEAAAPRWQGVLRRGGGMALAWNTKVAARGDATAILEAAGFEVIEPPTQGSFLHAVDRSIERDVLLARRP